MKINLAILNLTGGGMCGGYCRFLQEILPRFTRREEIRSVLCVAPMQLRLPKLIPACEHVKYESCRPLGLSMLLPDKKLIQSLNAFQPDIIFVPVERSFCYGNVPVVNMVHNMLPLIDYMDKTSLIDRVRRRYQRIDARKAFERASRIVAVSDYVGELLRKQYCVPANKVETIHYGADDIRDIVARRPPAIPESMQNRFIFTAGSIEAYRGIEDVLGAGAVLTSRGTETPIVIAGSARPEMRGYLSALRRMATHHGVDGQVVWAGNLSQEEMAWCYQNCSVFVTASRMESFGLVNVEALRYGCPCIAAEASCLPEIFGNAARYYNAGDVSALAHEIKDVLHYSDERRAEAQAGARARAGQFQWNDTVDRFVDLFQESVRC